MLKGMLDHFFKSPSIDWIQVEVTSRCNAACFYCPRTAYRDGWLNRDLSVEDFQRLAPIFGRTGMIFLQGWGEPFLNPHMMTMVRMAKEAGCTVGTTTNGMLLNEEMIGRLVASGVDLVAFSLAGVHERNDTHRRGTNGDTIAAAIRLLDETKRKAGTELPAVHIAYVLLRSGLDDLKRLPLFLRGLPVSQVILSTLDFVPCEELKDETILPATGDEYEQLRSRLDALKVQVEAEGVELHYRLHRPGKPNSACTENIQRSFFVSSDGSVSPCVFTNLPLAADAHIFRDGERPCRRLTFGNIRDTDIRDIWQGQASGEFRKTFRERQVPEVCTGCPKLFVGEDR